MFWNTFTSLCEKAGKSPNQVAAEIGCKSTGTVSNWKNGAVPRNNIKAKLAEYFGVDVSVFSDEQKEKAPLPQNGREADIQALLDILRNQNDEDYAFSMAAIGKILK